MENRPSTIKQTSKPLLFGICGTIGCLIAALLGEAFLLFALPTNLAPTVTPKIDIIFVLDVTSSMEFGINGVRQGIQNFAGELDKQKLDSRVGLIAFRDRFQKEEPEILTFDGSPFTSNNRLFSEKVGELKAAGGGDPPESSLDALTLAAQQSFRPNATKVILLITDAPPKQPDVDTPSVAVANQILTSRSIDQLHLVIQERDRNTYLPLQTGLAGEIFPLNESVTGRSGFDRILPKIGGKIAEITVRGLQSNREFAQDSLVRVIAATAAWTSLLAAGIALALIAGQNHYLLRRIITPAQFGKGALGGAIAGLIAGSIGQAIFIPLSNFPLLLVIGRILGWGILGALVGLGMALFVPNLQRRRGVIGGTVGGSLGAIGFLVGGGIFGDVAGRLLGAATLGLCIGLAIAWIEVFSQQAWLVVSWPNNEQRKIILGREPILLGSADSAHIYLPKNTFPPQTAEIYYEPVSDRVVIQFNKVMQEKGMKVLEQVLEAGKRRKLGDIFLEINVNQSAINSSKPP
jgi:Ca-activated chloride channel homolog